MSLPNVFSDAVTQEQGEVRRIELNPGITTPHRSEMNSRISVSNRSVTARTKETHVEQQLYSKTIKDTLTLEQKQAVESPIDSPMLVNAGPGSGKTLCLCGRICHLIDCHVDPFQIVCVTFTKKAAQEMGDRMKKYLPKHLAEALTTCTFHSLCTSILRRYITRLGFKREFKIFNGQDQSRVIRKLLQSGNHNDVKLPENGPRRQKVMSSDVRFCVGLIDCAKTNIKLPKHFSAAETRLFEAYQNQLRKSSAIDFGDMILLTVELFGQYPDILNEYRQNWRHFLVDEFQDTNGIQFELIRMFCLKSGHIWAVGDLNQSVYGWRGADQQNSDRFVDLFKSSVSFLRQNFRSSRTIVNTSSRLIGFNTIAIPDVFVGNGSKLWSNFDGPPMSFRLARNPEEEADDIARRILSLCTRTGHTSMDTSLCSQIAVLYRMRRCSQNMEYYFRVYGIPYTISGEPDLLSRGFFINLFSILRLISEEFQDDAFERVLGLSAKKVTAPVTRFIKDVARKKSCDLYKAARIVCGKEPDSVDSDIQIRRLRILDAVLNSVDEVKAFCHNASMHDIIEHTILVIWRLQEKTEKLQTAQQPKNTDVDNPDYHDPYEEAFVRNNLHGARMAKFLARRFDGSYNEDVKKPQGTALIRTFLADCEREKAKERRWRDSRHHVTLSTVHAAKGLEFETVFIIQLVDGVMPVHMISNLDPDELSDEQIFQYNDKAVNLIEEERRVCYVAVTRCKRNLYLSSTRYNDMGEVACQSQFLDEMMIGNGADSVLTAATPKPPQLPPPREANPFASVGAGLAVGEAINLMVGDTRLTVANAMGLSVADAAVELSSVVGAVVEETTRPARRRREPISSSQSPRKRRNPFSSSKLLCLSDK